MPNWGGGASGAASGAATGALAGSVVPGLGTLAGGAIGGIGGFLSGLFSGGGSKKTPTDDDPEVNDLIANLRASSDKSRATGDALTGMSADALGPVLSYFKRLTSGDPSAALSATRPERTRVIDQYDTARKMISEFSPRGGGSNAALAESRFDEASDLSNITALARRDAVGQQAQLGTTLAGLGMTADQLASADLNTVLNAILAEKGFDVQKSGQKSQMAAGLAEGLGTLVGLYLTRGGGGGGDRVYGTGVPR